MTSEPLAPRGDQASTIFHDISTSPPQDNRNVIMFAVTERDADGAVTNWKMATGHIRHGADDPFRSDFDGYTSVYWDGRLLRMWDVMPTHWAPLPLPPAALIAPTNHSS